MAALHEVLKTCGYIRQQIENSDDDCAYGAKRAFLDLDVERPAKSPRGNTPS